MFLQLIIRKRRVEVVGLSVAFKIGRRWTRIT
jgi:hypothetical protein